jgi:hypothetical protein
MNKRNIPRGAQPRRNALAIALAVGLGFTGFAYGQATTGAIFGSAPAAAGQTVKITGSGINRSTTVNASGRYSVANLPVGAYTVTLTDASGNAVSSRNNVRISVGAGTEVDFAASATNAQNLGAVQVNANALPAIDVTSVTNSTIITADDLAKLPVGHNAESIALLSPGTVSGSPFFGNVVSFGGSSAAENAYYVNGYNTGEPYRNIGGFQLPYGSIAQQETLAGGFSAKYGRSDGGVISQVGKRGTDEWHFGGQVSWEPRYLESDPDNIMYPTQPLPSGPGTYQHESTYAPGTIHNYNNDNKGWQTIYSAYAGGPLIQDKLYVFVSAEVTKSSNTSVTSNTRYSPDAAPFLGDVSYSTSHSTKYYGKLDWNINDNNILEATVLQNNSASGSGSTYKFNYADFTSGEFVAGNNKSTDNAKFNILHYTSYLSDNATLSVVWGQGSFANPVTYANKSTLPYVQGTMDPSKVPPGGIVNDQTNISVIAPDSSLRTQGLRADFNYQLGDHNLGVGIDNMHYTAHDQDFVYTGGHAPAEVSTALGDAVLHGTRWIYYNAGSLGGYAARYLNIAFQASMSTEQKAYYLQDVWQTTDNLQLNLGVRNDHYINNNNAGVAFVNMKNQWEPRLGFSWDVNGDSSFKIYGNAGRYYLALPTNAAERAATASVYVSQYFAYSGINADGTPILTNCTAATTGNTRIDGTGNCAITSIASPDGETGLAKDPKQVTAANLRPMYIDQYNIGFDKQLNENWTYGASISYRDLKTTIDDECSPGQVANKMTSMGLDPNDYYDSLYGAAYCRLVNPGQSSDLLVKNGTTGEYTTVTMTQADWGYLQKPKRTYAALNLYMEHQFDGKWYGRIDYTYTYAHGNTAGQIRPDFGQADVSKTEDWDSWQLMEGADGELLNSRKHMIRLRGDYQLNPEWLFSAVALVASGTPQECLGYYGPDATGDPTGYNRGASGNYHWCAGQIVHPGSDSPYAGHTAWTHQLSLGVHYAPAFADHKLAFKLDVFNVLNEQHALQSTASLVSAEHQISNTFHYPVSLEAPRTVRLSVSYDY